MYEKDKKHVLNLRINNDLSEYLYQLASERGVSVSDLVRYILTQYMIKN